MKFLESKEIEKEFDNVKVIFKPVGPVNQAALIGYQIDLSKALNSGVQKDIVFVKMQMTAYSLKEMISGLYVDGDYCDPLMVASSADITDQDTVNVLNIVFDLTVSLLVEGDTKKKSSMQQSPIKKGKAAKDAREVTEA